MPNLIGSGIQQIPTNGMLGNLAFQDKAYVSVDKIGIGTTAVDTGTANQSLQNYGGAYISGNTGIGTTNPQVALDVVGNVRVVGVTTLGVTSATNLTAQQLNVSGVSTVGFITATNIWNAGITTSSRITLNGANDGATGGGQIYLNGATGNRIDFNTNGVNPPAFSNRSNGTKIVLYPTIGASAVDYAFGIDTNTLWYSIPTATSTAQHRWYAGITTVADLKGTGELVIGSTSLTGTASQRLQVTGGAYVSGSVGIGTTNPTSKLSVVGDGNFTGVVTATSFRGDGSQLTGITASGSVSISTNTTNSNLLIPYATSFGSTTGLGATSLLVYNPSSGNAGIGTTNPTSKLSVVGDANFTGVVTATTFVGALSGTATSTTNIPNLSGDVSSNNTVTTLATVNSNVGTYGDAGAIPSITVNAKGLVTGVTTVAPNNGQLSLAVSGTGLSGSATFTANQSGSSTFTVTSNATDANTPSTIVARDASGNFSAGTITANLTGTATTATNLADAANITTGTINSARLSGTYNINVSYASTAGIATVAQGLTGTPNITVGVVTATSFVKSGGTSSQFLKADGSVDSSTYLTTTGSGTNLTGIVTSIVAGSNITISGSTGQVTINSTATGGGAALDILEVMLFA